MTYLCNHPNLGATKEARSPLALLEQKRAIFHSALFAAARSLCEHGERELSDGLYYAATELLDALRYTINTPSQPIETVETSHE